ncbi:hypothetical protein DSO57_1031883 [Entomophthora muscae]|uniref:Uncharacterized protein n=1 Tax=Entomophthora muscae TaxID=34485 RepID=A0ACC2SDX1_9FUNG|nr:hypothetical protein DSO57_1031883 [Entomophthora muscae]
MSSFNNNQVNKLFPGLDKIMQGYTVSSNSEAFLYGHSQPAGPSASATQESVLFPATSSMALFAHHAQAAANPNSLSSMASGTSHFSHGVTQSVNSLPPLALDPQFSLVVPRKVLKCLPNPLIL